MSSFLQRFKSFAASNPKLSKILVAIVMLYVLKKLRNKHRHSKRQFTSTNQINNRAVLITGCDTGFGKATAQRLHSMGFCVIATVLKKESADEYNQTWNNSTNCSQSYVMDITKVENISAVRNKVAQHLQSNSKQLWAIVNNAGIAPVGPFEMYLPKYMHLWTQVLLVGHLNVTREFLSLMEGRKNYTKSALDLSFQNANGGRIINISSCSAHLPSNVWALYGALKAAITYWSHGLRYELSPRFGIFPCAIEPEGYATNIWNVLGRMEKLKAEIDESVWEVYETDDAMERIKESLPRLKAGMHQTCDEVVDCICHGITAKHPKKVYRPGWGFIFRLARIVPTDLVNRIVNRPK